MSTLTEAYAVTLKLTPAQHQWLTTTAATMAELHGQNVTHSAVIMRLMELGAPQLGQAIALEKGRNAAARRTAPRLSVVRAPR